MSRSRLLVAALLGFAAVAALAAVAPRPRAAAPPAPPAVDAKVRLAVLLVFDQMRADYLDDDRWRRHFGSDGFVRLQTEGAWFNRCLYPYASTITGPGHASVLSGTCPDRHGVVANGWYEGGADVGCVATDRYRLVASADLAAGAKPGRTVGSPDRFKSECVGDSLKRATGGRGKVFGLSLKDRAAVLPAGKRPDGAFWFEGRTIAGTNRPSTFAGGFVTSTYYTDRLPAWAEAFNAGGSATRFAGSDWTHLLKGLDYEAYSGPDDVPAEGSGRTFPHRMPGAKGVPAAGYYDQLSASPFGNEVLLDLAKSCVVAERLGQRRAGRPGEPAGWVPDLLTVSFSSNDIIGHKYGPSSQEVFDVTLRSDRVVAELLAFLDKQVGPGNYAVVVTADHGVCPLPESAEGRKLGGKRVNTGAMKAAAEKHLEAAFGKPAGVRRGGWIEAVDSTWPWVHLNPRAAAAAGTSTAEVARVLADFLARQDGVERVFTRAELLAGPPADDEMGVLMKRSFDPARCGDVGVVLKEYHLPGGGVGGSGTTHGSPHDYDRHVPLLVYGPGVPGGERDERVTPQAAAAIVADFLGVPPPRDAEFPVPATLRPE